jgi:hypothetical protein
MLIKAELSFLLERVDHHTSFCTEFCLISGGNIPYESYITPAKDPYATRECELVDNSVEGKRELFVAYTWTRASNGSNVSCFVRMLGLWVIAKLVFYALD